LSIVYSTNKTTVTQTKMLFFLLTECYFIMGLKEKIEIKQINYCFFLKKW